MESVADRFRQEAAHLGFSPVRFAEVKAPSPGHEVFERWLDRGHHGAMTWIQRHRDPRRDPRLLLPEARTVMVLGTPYGHPSPPDPGGLTGCVARHARGRDYHRVIEKRLRRLISRLKDLEPGLQARPSVDSRPVPERAWAMAAGLGFQGRSGCLIAPGHGPYVFLATLLLSIPLPPDAPSSAGCGDCTLCVDACPTGALAGDGTVDARRCLSALTLEHRGLIPADLWPAVGRRLAGCDTCMEVCPEGRGTREVGDPAFAPARAWLHLPTLLATPDEELGASLTGTTLRRPGATLLKRNACVVLANDGAPDACAALERARYHPDPVVRGTASMARSLLSAGPG